MKKRRGTARAVPLIAAEELQEMETRRLLARLERLRFCEPSLEASDMDQEEADAVEGILFKSSPEWQAAYREVKALLATREHVRRPGEEREPRTRSKGSRLSTAGRRDRT